MEHQTNYRIRKNDIVQVIAGKDKGKTGKVMRIVPKKDRAIVEKINMVKRHMKLKDLAEKVDITMANLSVLKQSKAKAIRFSTLEALCRELDCQPGDILKYVRDREEEIKSPQPPAARRSATAA